MQGREHVGKPIPRNQSRHKGVVSGTITVKEMESWDPG
jgi:hypothetical protein